MGSSNVVRCICATAAVMGMAGSAGAQPLSVSFLNTVTLPTQAQDGAGQTVTLAGISGLTWVGGSRWLAVMDNSNRVVELSIAFDGDLAITSATVTRVYTLADSADFEDLALADPQGETVWLCEEGQTIRKYDLATGARLLTVPAPAPLGTVVPNFGFEAMTAPSRPRQMWVCNEEAIPADGPLSTPTTGTLVRLVCLRPDAGGWSPAGQYAYRTAPIHGSVTTGSRSGVSALVLLPSGKVLTMERSLAFNIFAPFQTRIYEVEFSGATDVSSVPGLSAATFTPVSKRLLYSGSHTNVEGLALGPRNASGATALVGIVDDGDPVSINRLVAWRITGDVYPACPADWNDDGGVDGDDVIAFFGDWDVSNADFNEDGGTDGDDVIAFFGRWDQNC